MNGVILACKHCGQAPTLGNNDKSLYEVCCDFCGTGVMDMEAPSAIMMWNLVNQETTKES
jgi:hypothetical protein